MTRKQMIGYKVPIRQKEEGEKIVLSMRDVLSEETINVEKRQEYLQYIFEELVNNVHIQHEVGFDLIDETPEGMSVDYDTLGERIVRKVNKIVQREISKAYVEELIGDTFAKFNNYVEKLTSSEENMTQIVFAISLARETDPFEHETDEPPVELGGQWNDAVADLF